MGVAADSVRIERVHGNLVAVEVPCPALDEGRQLSVRDEWRRASSRNSALFCGPVAGALDVRRSTRNTELVWCETTFDRYLARRSRDRAARSAGLAALFVSAAVRFPEGGLLLVRAAPGTSNAGTWMLPGGAVSLAELRSASTLATEAARELSEETGLRVERHRSIWVKTGGDHGDVGIIFEFATERDAASIMSEVCAHLLAAGTGSEVDQALVVCSPSDLEALMRRAVVVDYLQSLSVILEANDGG